MLIERISVDGGRKSLGDALTLDRGDHPPRVLEKTKSGKLAEPSLL